MSSFTAEWSDLLTWPITLWQQAVGDAYGNKGWASPLTISAHLDSTDAGESSGTGREGVGQVGQFSGTLYFHADRVPQVGDRVVFADGTVVNLASVTAHYDIAGELHHYQCTFEQVD